MCVGWDLVTIKFINCKTKKHYWKNQELKSELETEICKVMLFDSVFPVKLWNLAPVELKSFPWK